MKYLKKALEKSEELEYKLVSNLLHLSETPFERHARETRHKEFLGTGLERLVTLYVPGVRFYKGIMEKKKEGFFDKDVPLATKAAVCGIVLASELIIDGVKVGLGYALYEWFKYLYS